MEQRELLFYEGLWMCNYPNLLCRELHKHTTTYLPAPEIYTDQGNRDILYTRK